MHCRSSCSPSPKRFAKAVTVTTMTSLRYAASPRWPLLGYQHQSSRALRPAGVQWMLPSQSPFHLATKASIKDASGGAETAAFQADDEPRRRRPSQRHERKTGELEDRVIRDQILNAAEPSAPSPYDTAWVAMVPARGSPGAPRFPRCVDWVLQNQHADGSWGLKLDDDRSLGKDALSSTMACVLALRTWGVGGEHVRKGLRFIGNNLSFATDEECVTPAGFNVIFPGMLSHGIGMGLEIPLAEQADVDAILRLRDTELKSIMASGSKAFMAYVAEGLGDLLDWDQATAYQRKNGSFFNSPATTAAAAIHNGHNDRALDYLDSLIRKFGSSERPADCSPGIIKADRHPLGSRASDSRGTAAFILNLGVAVPEPCALDDARVQANVNVSHRAQARL
ncbi:Stemod-13(17)-ene synthase [Dichanthelium oligosanthes]|uniref:Stemod-13(17)-ene synthase n=1 Tax=Dichanthelium oligosanthes TaxID=888268 RepID=A0A1E5WE51_9POAL|nr:Stemod-13(17)-ene synthase [Dichanthelium oligosanthes]